ncbi:MAG TPA: glycosyltransferase [Pyrinomonadaceae bacterium]|jgi:glycosyltransferase involved in cell wall biosynthesis
MIKVIALTSSRNDPSTRFRVRQFIEPLGRLGVKVSEYYPLISKYRLERLPLPAALLRLPGLAATRFGDITWLGRELLSGRAGLERYAAGKRLFDVDDAIWLVFKNSFSEEIARESRGVIAGNSFIAEHYERCGARVWLVPTSVDTGIWRPAELADDERFTIGWTGTWSNLPYLYQIEEPLAEFLAEHKESRLLVVCDREPSFERIPAARWQFAAWSPASEVKMVQSMDVGLMPLADTEWARGKCGFKMLSYMAAGVPVIVSPVGVNEEILQKALVGFSAVKLNDWYGALQSIYNDRGAGRRMGAAGRKVVEEHYSVKKSAALLAQIFQEVAGE